jgi:hypothetical protein
MEALSSSETSVLRTVRRLLVRANVVRSSPILVILTMEALSYSETSVLRSVRRLLVTATVVPSSDSCHPDAEGGKFPRNVGSYKSHTA